MNSTHAASHATDSDTTALYRRHWPALCAFARSRGCATHDAEDAVQELFAKLVAQGQHERAAAIMDHGEQAAFLFARLRTHLIKRWQHRTRQCRGGGTACFSLSSEDGADIDVADLQAAPDREIDRVWARGVIDRALSGVRAELQSQGRRDVWDCLEQQVVGGRRSTTPQRGALRTALHRARQRLRALIRTECRTGEDENVLYTVLA